MRYLGLLTLGIFVGTLLGIAVRMTTNWSDAVKVIAGIISVALSGVVFTFIQRMWGHDLGPALYMYPVGLAYSLVWLFADQAISNVKSDNLNLTLVGWLHIAGMVLATVLVLLFLLSDNFRRRLPT